MKQITAAQTKDLPEGARLQLRTFDGRTVDLIVTGDGKLKEWKTGKTVKRSDTAGEFFVEGRR